jgi:hypothetical protein
LRVLSLLLAALVGGCTAEPVGDSLLLRDLSMPAAR